MTDFKYRSKPLAFKLGVVERTETGLRSFAQRDLTQFQTQTRDMANKPIITAKLPEPNIFFTPIQDNRDQVLERMKRELEYQLDITKNVLPARY